MYRIVLSFLFLYILFVSYENNNICSSNITIYEDKTYIRVMYCLCRHLRWINDKCFICYKLSFSLSFSNRGKYNCLGKKPTRIVRRTWKQSTSIFWSCNWILSNFRSVFKYIVNWRSLTITFFATHQHNNCINNIWEWQSWIMIIFNLGSTNI
jgi:hypothetical protein